MDAGLAGLTVAALTRQEKTAALSPHAVAVARWEDNGDNQSPDAMEGGVWMTETGAPRDRAIVSPSAIDDAKAGFILSCADAHRARTRVLGQLAHGMSRVLHHGLDTPSSAARTRVATAREAF